jgi:transposase
MTLNIFIFIKLDPQSPRKYCRKQKAKIKKAFLVYQCAMFSEKDSYLLQELAKKCRNAKERERLRALYALSVGYPIDRVAEIFCIDETTLYRWMEKWQGDDRLCDKPKKGRPNSLSEDDLQQIRELIIEGDPRAHGIDASAWNTKALREYLCKRGKRISQETVRRCLKKIGARYIKREDAYTEAERKAWKDFVRVLISTLNYNPEVIYPLFEKEIPMPSDKNYAWILDSGPLMKDFGQSIDDELEEQKPKKGPAIKKTEKDKEIEALLNISQKE